MSSKVYTLGKQLGCTASMTWPQAHALLEVQPASYYLQLHNMACGMVKFMPGKTEDQSCTELYPISLVRITLMHNVHAYHYIEFMHHQGARAGVRVGV